MENLKKYSLEILEKDLENLKNNKYNDLSIFSEFKKNKYLLSTVSELTDTLISKKMVRWNNEETTKGRKSYTISHSFATAKIIELLFNERGIKKDKNLYVLAGLFHDNCESVYGDVTVGEVKNKQKEIDEKFENNEKLKTLASDIKELQDTHGVLTIIKDLLKKINKENKEDTYFIIKAILMNDTPLVKFIERLETMFLYLRKDITKTIEEKKTDSVFTYIEKPLETLKKDENIPESIRKICENLKDLYIKDFSGKKINGEYSDLYNTIKKISDDCYYADIIKEEKITEEKNKEGFYWVFKEKFELNSYQKIEELPDFNQIINDISKNISNTISEENKFNKIKTAIDDIDKAYLDFKNNQINRR